jgi:signal transduction histidine kinase
VQEIALAHINVAVSPHLPLVPMLLEDFIHELRQPLGVIESLAYYLELTATDRRNSIHLERIRAMVAETNYILERASLVQPELAIRTTHIPGS